MLSKPIPVFILFLLLYFNPNASLSQEATPESSERPKVGLVLSGGGAKGLAFAGLLKVIHDAGLQVDYIGGTSMGSIMGGLYAAGYHPDSIVELIRSQNWDDLLTDKIDRAYVAYEEKEFGEKYIVSLPFVKKKVALSHSLYQGQEINLMLNRYLSPTYTTTDFRDLHTPFLCIGTDLLTGEEVIIDNGYLPMAIRASMSIPGYFSPTDYQGYYLVDGGVINNFPVPQVKEMGAKLIIGGDVQQGLSKTREELNSLTAILDQITSYYRVEANEIAYENTELYINIDTETGMMDFDSYDSIMAIGEKVAHEYYDKIKALADSLNSIEYKPMKVYNTVPLTTFSVDSVIIRGNKKMSLDYFNTIFGDDNNSELSLDDLEEKIRFMYGTRFFEHVFYEFDQKNGKNNLIIDVKEAQPGYISAGIHYDNNYSGSILVNGSFRNVLGRETKLFADVVLGVNPRLRAMYLKDRGSKAGYGVKIDIYSFGFDTYDKDTKTNTIDFTNYKGSIFYNSSFQNLYSFRAGLDYEYFRFQQDVNIDSTLDQYSDFTSYGTMWASFKADSRDHPVFSTKGIKSELRIEYVSPLGGNWSEEIFTNSFVAYADYDQNISIAKKFVLRPGLFAGVTLNENQRPPLQHRFAFGGLNPDNYIERYSAFTGTEFIQTFGFYAGIARLKLQYNFVKKMYFTLRTDLGSNEDQFDELFRSENLMFGYGLTYSYNSFIGPIELTLMSSNLNPKPMIYLNLGFWF